MPIDALNDYTALQATDTADATLYIDTSGRLVDGNGNYVTLGSFQSGIVSWGFDNEGVDRTKDYAPNSTAQLKQNGNILTVDDNAVTLTGPSGRREVHTVGGNNGQSGPVKVDSNSDLYTQYTTIDTVDGTNSSNYAFNSTGTYSVSEPFLTGQNVVTVHESEAQASVFSTGTMESSGELQLDSPTGTRNDQYDQSSTTVTSSDRYDHQGDTVTATVNADQYDDTSDDDVVEVFTYIKYDRERTSTPSISLF